MAKDPAFLFYPGDWLGGTIGMTFEEKGAYMELLMMQFTRGHMTERMIAQTVGQLWVNLQDKFQKDDEGLFFNARLDEEKEKRKSYVDSRKNNKSGKNQHTEPKKEKGHMTSHMEDENEIENNNEVENLIKETSLKILTDFNFTEIRNPNHLMKISSFVRFLFVNNNFDYFTEQYPAYWEYKKLSGAEKQSLDTFLNGGWDRESWTEKLKELQGKLTKPEKESRLSQAQKLYESATKNNR